MNRYPGKGVDIANFVISLLKEHPEGMPFTQIYKKALDKFGHINREMFKFHIWRYAKNEIGRKVVKDGYKIKEWVWWLKGNGEPIVGKSVKTKWYEVLYDDCVSVAEYAKECFKKGELPVLDKKSKCYSCNYFKFEGKGIWCDIGGLDEQYFEVEELVRDLESGSFHVRNSFKELIIMLKKARKCRLMRNGNNDIRI